MLSSGVVVLLLLLAVAVAVAVAIAVAVAVVVVTVVLVLVLVCHQAGTDLLYSGQSSRLTATNTTNFGGRACMAHITGRNQCATRPVHALPKLYVPINNGKNNSTRCPYNPATKT